MYLYAMRSSPTIAFESRTQALAAVQVLDLGPTVLSREQKAMKDRQITISHRFMKYQASSRLQ